MQVEIAEFTLRNSPLPLIVLNENLHVLDYSNAVFRFFEHPEHQKLGTFNEIFGETPESLISAAKKRGNYVETLPIISKKGRTRWIRTSMYPVKGKEKTFQMFFDDVTEGKEQFELAIQAKKIAKIGSWRVNLTNNTVSWSKITKDIHEVADDFEPDLEQGINFYKKGVHRDKIIKAVSECIENGRPFDLELIIVTAKGNEKWVRAIGEAEINNGKTTGFKGVFQDVDEIKKERIRSQTITNRIKVAVESANIGVWDWDIVNDNLIWDNNMFALFDIDPSKFEGAYDAWESVVLEEDKEQAKFEVGLALEGKKKFDTVFRIRKSDGSIAFIQGRAEVFKNEEGIPVRMIGTNTDISRVKRKDERLRNLLELTEKQNQKLVNFAHIVSHNLRSNSSNISMLSGMLLNGVGKEKNNEFLNMIRTSSEKLEETLNQLNEIVRIQETNRQDLVRIKVKTVFDNVCESINAIVLESKAKILWNIHEEELSVKGLKPYLTSIFLNLLTNSIKYRNPRKPLEIEVRSEILMNQTIISFQDNGLGIDLNKHGNKIFGMYKTFHGNKDAKGIGLFISKNQMEAMNGKIEVKSEINKGTTFLLYFKN